MNKSQKKLVLKQETLQSLTTQSPAGLRQGPSCSAYSCELQCQTTRTCAAPA